MRDYTRYLPYSQRRPRTTSRRSFLRSSSAVVAGLGAIAVGATAVTGAKAGAGGDAEASRTLLRMSRDIYPHDDLLTDEPYQAVVDAILAETKENKDTAKLVGEGLSDLNERSASLHGARFADIVEESKRVGILTAIEFTPFFQKVRGGLLFGIYNNQALWPKFGYEGSSWEHGGYIDRGYSDATWIPAGPTEAERIAAVK